MRELYQVVEVGPAWYQDNIPCQEACPVRTNCRGYLNLAAAGEFEKAWELALDPNPMASICGSVCAAPCETACRRKEVDKPLSIRYVKKFLSDWTHQNVRVDGHGYTQPAAPVFGKPSGRVAVVGAGCAGLSAASDLAKLGFGVTVLDALDQAGGTALAGVPPFRLPREERVVDEEELGETEREGINFVYLAGPVEVTLDEKGHASGVKFVRNKLGEPDKSGRRSPEPIPGSEFVIPCDNVLLALSQNPDTTWLADIPEFRVKRARDLGIDAETYQSVVPKIFFAGDYRTGPTTIIEAVADGRSAAQQIARVLDPIAIAVNVPEYHEIVTLRRSSTPDNVGQIALEGELARIYHNMSVDYDRIPRQEMPKLQKKDRRGLFLEVNQGYTEAQAVAESDRCLKCNFNIEIIGELCIICGGCVDVCPMDVIHMVDMSDIVDDGSIPAVAGAKKWENGVAFFLDETACIRCALCIIRCPTDAITMNRYGTVMPAVGNILPKESIDDEIHLDLTVAAKKAARPLPQYDPHLAPGYKPLQNGHKNGDFKHAHDPDVNEKELVKH